MTTAHAQHVGRKPEMQTKSEQLFEQFCDANAIAWEPIPRASMRTPDYRIWLGEQLIICEIKQIEASDAERKAWRDSGNPGASLVFSPPNQLRSKLKKLGQLGGASSDGLPTLLIVYNNSSLPTALEHVEVVQAMYGDLLFVETVGTADVSSETAAVSLALGGGRSLTPDHNTSLSAVGILEFDQGQLSLRVYHNLHAKVVLDPLLLDDYPIDQRVLPGDTRVSLE